MNPPTDIETRLRASLTENARHAPPGAPLADRIVAELDAPVLRPRGGWRTWTFPLLAAAAIAAVAFTLVGIDRDRHTATPVQPGTHAVPSHGPSMSPTPAPTTSPSAATTRAKPVPTSGFHALDVTFVGTTDGWALGTEPCISDPTHRCTAILRTTDGKNWSGIGGEDFNASAVSGCRAPCVEHIRFANSEVGYAFGPDALFMTTDGGAHWVRRPGMGADALETLSGNAILVRAVDSGCPSRCPLFERAPIGSSSWTAFTLPHADLSGVMRIDLSRDGHTAILAPIFYNPAKPNVISSALYRSGDDGATWTRINAACPSAGVGDGRQLTAAAMGSDGSVAIDCATTVRSNPVGFGETAVSTDGGRTFTAPKTGGALLPGDLIATPTQRVQLIVVRGTLYRSDDGGDSWSQVPNLTDVTFVGFENQHDGRAVADGGQTIWVTSDGGASWSGGRFSH